MNFKLTNIDLRELHGKSGKFEVSPNYVVFAARDGNMYVVAEAIRPRQKMNRSQEETHTRSGVEWEPAGPIYPGSGILSVNDGAANSVS